MTKEGFRNSSTTAEAVRLEHSSITSRLSNWSTNHPPVSALHAPAGLSMVTDKRQYIRLLLFGQLMGHFNIYIVYCLGNIRITNIYRWIGLIHVLNVYIVISVSQIVGISN